MKLQGCGTQKTQSIYNLTGVKMSKSDNSKLNLEQPKKATIQYHGCQECSHNSTKYIWHQTSESTIYVGDEGNEEVKIQVIQTLEGIVLI